MVTALPPKMYVPPIQVYVCICLYHLLGWLLLFNFIATQSRSNSMGPSIKEVRKNLPFLTPPPYPGGVQNC